MQVTTKITVIRVLSARFYPQHHSAPWSVTDELSTSNSSTRWCTSDQEQHQYQKKKKSREALQGRNSAGPGRVLVGTSAVLDTVGTVESSSYAEFHTSPNLWNPGRKS